MQFYSQYVQYIGISSLISVDFVNNLSYENLYSTLHSDILNFRLIVIRIYIYPSKTNKIYPIQIPLYALLLSGQEEGSIKDMKRLQPLPKMHLLMMRKAGSDPKISCVMWKNNNENNNKGVVKTKYPCITCFCHYTLHYFVISLVSIYGKMQKKFL